MTRLTWLQGPRLLLLLACSRDETSANHGRRDLPAGDPQIVVCDDGQATLYVRFNTWHTDKPQSVCRQQSPKHDHVMLHLKTG